MVNIRYLLTRSDTAEEWVRIFRNRFRDPTAEIYKDDDECCHGQSPGDCHKSLMKLSLQKKMCLTFRFHLMS